MKFTAAHERRPTGVSALRAESRRIVLTDESVRYRLRLSNVEVTTIALVNLEQLTRTGWRTVQTVWRRGAAAEVDGTVRLDAGTTEIRCRAAEPGSQSVTPSLPVDVRAAPPVLILLSMGGWWGGSPPQPDGPANVEAAQLEERHGIRVDPDRCRLRGIPSDLIQTLVTNRNVQCNDLCSDSCVNFIEHLALRLQGEEKLADVVRSISGSCDDRTSNDAMHNTVVIGKWENSELEAVRPPGITTWEQILDRHRNAGGREVIMVGQSHGGAKFAGLTRESDGHWRWGNDLNVELFVSWDSADLFGGVSSVGDRPQTVLAFYQRADILPMQNGNHIEEATEEHNLTDLFSHNAIPRSQFVHDKTVTFIRDAVSHIRGRRRNGDSATFRLTDAGAPIERIESLRIGACHLAHAAPTSSGPVLCLVPRSDDVLRIRRITEHGLVGALVDERPLAAGYRSAASCRVGANTYLLLVRQTAGWPVDNDRALIFKLDANGAIVSRHYPKNQTERDSGPLHGAWDFAGSFQINGRQFLAVASTNGELKVVEISAAGSLTAVADGGPNLGFLGPQGLGDITALAFHRTAGHAYLLTGHHGVSVRRMKADGTVDAVTWQDSSMTSLLESIDAIQVVPAVDGDVIFVGLSTGAMRVRTFHPDGTLGDTVHDGLVGGGRQALATYEIGGNAYAFVVDRPT